VECLVIYLLLIFLVIKVDYWTVMLITEDLLIAQEEDYKMTQLSYRSISLKNYNLVRMLIFLVHNLLQHLQYGCGFLLLSYVLLSSVSVLPLH